MSLVISFHLFNWYSHVVRNFIFAYLIIYWNLYITAQFLTFCASALSVKNMWTIIVRTKQKQRGRHKEECWANIWIFCKTFSISMVLYFGTTMFDGLDPFLQEWSTIHNLWDSQALTLQGSSPIPQNFLSNLQEQLNLTFDMEQDNKKIPHDKPKSTFWTLKSRAIKSLWSM